MDPKKNSKKFQIKEEINQEKSDTNPSIPGYIGPEDDLKIGFEGRIPYFVDYGGKVEKIIKGIFKTDWKDHMNNYIIAYFDISGGGKSTLLSKVFLFNK